MTAQESNVANAAESTLSSGLAQAATTVNVTDTSAFPAAPFYATIDPGDDAKREVVRATGKTSTTLTITRGQDGTSDVAHDSGAVIGVYPVAALWTDINDRVDAKADTSHSHTESDISDLGTYYEVGGTDVAVADGGTGASTAADARTNLSAASTSHAATHSNGGTDEVTVENLGTAATDTSQVLKPDGSGGLSFGAVSAGTTHTIVRKSSDESVTSSTTLQDDDDLTFSVAANDVWVFEMFLAYTADASGDLQVNVTVPSGATLTYGGIGPNAGATGDGLFRGRTDSTVINAYAGAGTSTVVVAILRGSVANGATAGSATLQWSQGASNANATTLKAGSYLVAHKVS